MLYLIKCYLLYLNLLLLCVITEIKIYVSKASEFGISYRNRPHLKNICVGKQGKSLRLIFLQFVALFEE